jgi:RND family efflux transporter MFP subunit
MRLLIGVIAAAMLAGCSASDDNSAEAEPIALVSIAPATLGAVDETVTLYGAVESGAYGKHVLAAPSEATLTAIDAPVGSAVRAGQVIARLTPSPTSRLDLAKAGSDAAAAQSAYARAQRLRADGLASDADVETARAAAQSAGATRASLSSRDRALTLRAPASGYVESIAFAPGDLVPAGGAVATVSASGSLRARFGMDPALAGRIHPGMALRVTTPGRDAPIAIPVQSVDPVIDPQTRLAAVFATVPPGAGIGTNATLSATIALTGNGSESLSVPYGALLDDGGQPYLFVVANGVAHRRDVEIGPVSGGRVAIAKGIRAGDRVVTAGGTALEDGMKVRTK